MIKRKIAAISLIATSVWIGASTSVYADKFGDAAKGAAQGIQTSAAGATKWLIMIALVIIGIAVAFGTQRQREGAKERAPSIVIGVALVLGATALSGIIFGWF